MSDMSVGQIVGGVVGAVVGFFYAGGPVGAIQGFALGAGIGGYIDPPPGPNLKGPTLSDKSFQSSAYGVANPWLHGSIATYGNVIYLENNEYKAVAKKESTGGKGGGGGGTYETTTYYATFAVALGRVSPGRKVRRIWAGGKLIYSAGTTDVGTILQSLDGSAGWKYYDGTQTEPDSRMEAVLGVDYCPSYEGTQYIIFYDFDLTDYGNSLSGCPIKVETVPANAVTEGGDDGALLGWFDASSLSPDDALHKVNCPISLAGKSFVSVLAWATQGSDVDAIGALRNIYFPAGVVSDSVEISPLYSSKSEGRSVVSGETNINSCWFVYFQNMPGTENDRYMVTNNNGLSYYRDGWSVSSVHEHSSTGAYLKIFNTSTGNFKITTVGGADIDVVAAGAVAVGGGVVAYCRTGGIDVYDSSLSLIRTVPNLLNINVSRGLTVFEKELVGHFLVVAGSVQSLNNGVFNYSVVNLQDGTYTSHSIDFGFDFHVDGGLGSWGNPSLSYVDGVFAYSNLFTESPSKWNHCGFIYFALPSEYGGSLNLSAGAEYLKDVVEFYIEKSGADLAAYDLTDLDGLLIDGYKVEPPVSARGALSQLQTAYLFDFVEDGYITRAIRRGGASVATIPYEHFILKDGAAVKSVDDDPSSLPSRYEISYIDYNREYDSNTQSAPYPSLINNNRSAQLAIVMSADSAAKLSDVLINLSHIEARKYQFELPQLYLWVKPSDILTAEVYPGYFIDVRIEDCSPSTDQTIAIGARRAEQSSYQSSAVGSEVEAPPETIPLISDSNAFLIDAPMIINDQDTAGFVAGLYGVGSWPGGVLMRSQDGGQSYSALQAFYGKTTAGKAEGVLPVSDGFVIDRSNTLAITVLAGDFFGISEAQMMTGKNFAAYGVAGRWEIIQFSGAAVTGSNQVVLSNFVRGMRGTEWATGLHQIGDFVVLLDDPDNVFCRYDLSQLMVSRQFKAVTVGENVQDASAFSFTYAGVNLKPLSPVNCIGEIVGADWHVEFSARTRYQGSYWYSGVQPQNEPVMSFAIDVLSGSTVVRTLGASTPDFIYTEAQQIEDFGSAQTSIHIRIYQISATVGRGYPLEVIL